MSSGGRLAEHGLGDGSGMSLAILKVLVLLLLTAQLSTLEKNVTLFIFVITESDVVQFCQFLAETYCRKFGTNTNAQAATSRFDIDLYGNGAV